jgi:hypothetical protein
MHLAVALLGLVFTIFLHIEVKAHICAALFDFDSEVLATNTIGLGNTGAGTRRFARLGGGRSADVYRIIEPNGSLRVIKVYRNDAQQLESDIRALVLLRSSFDLDRKFGAENPIVNVIGRINERTVELESIVGAGFDVVIEIAESARKELLILRYNDLLQRIVEKLRSFGEKLLAENKDQVYTITEFDPSELTFSYRTLHAHFRIQGRSIEFFIKPDNILVDSNDELRLIDPY